MISSKILVQTATAGLMAGAILAMPLFVFDAEDTSFNSRACPYASERIAFGEGDRTGHFEPPMLRAAPAPTRAEQPHEASLRELHEYRRSLAARNQAANAALEQIRNAYEHTDAHRQGVSLGHTVTLNTLARQTATQIDRNTRIMTRCRGENFEACKQVQKIVLNRQFGLERR